MSKGCYDPLLEIAGRTLSEGFVQDVHRDLLLSDSDPRRKKRLLDRCGQRYSAPAVDKWGKPSRHGDLLIGRWRHSQQVRPVKHEPDRQRNFSKLPPEYAKQEQR